MKAETLRFFVYCILGAENRSRSAGDERNGEAGRRGGGEEGRNGRCDRRGDAVWRVEEESVAAIEVTSKHVGGDVEQHSA